MARVSRVAGGDRSSAFKEDQALRRWHMSCGRGDMQPFLSTGFEEITPLLSDLNHEHHRRLSRYRLQVTNHRRQAAFKDCAHSAGLKIGVGGPLCERSGTGQ
jgi:hypothetical protein